jgi:putative ABC transport system ATP-binding protein
MLELKQIFKTFHAGTPDERVALDNISLKVETGDFVTVIGANGAGKSTLFNAVSGTFNVDKGTILLDGKDITRMPAHKRSRVIGQLFQDPMKGSAPHMSIEENMFLASGRGGWLGAMKKKDRDDFRDQLRQLGMGLEDRMTQQVGLLSGGQRQALTLLMAALQNPKLLLLDEHTAALDPATAAKVLEISDQIVTETNLTALMITHNMTDALKPGNRLIMMNQGRIVFDVSGEEKKRLTKRDLLDAFANVKDDTDAVLLS